MNKIKDTLLVLGIAAASIVGFAGVAGATTPPTPGEVVGNMADEGIAGVLDIFSTNAGKLVVLAVVTFGVRWVMKATNSGGKKAT